MWGDEMIFINEKLKRNLSDHLFDIVGIGAGLAFTIFFAVFDTVVAIKASGILLLSIILFLVLMAFITNGKTDVIEAAKWTADNGSYNAALKILAKARKKAGDDEFCLKLDYETAVVYCSMEQYQEAVKILRGILENDATEWIWEVYFQLAKALCHTEGHFSNAVLDAYLNCVMYRREFEEYGKGDFKQDIYVCHEISEIYRVKKNNMESSRWFRDEMILREVSCGIGIKNKIKDLLSKAAALANENHAEDALRIYEEAAYLIERNNSEDCDKYAIVQLEMGKLLWKGYEIPRYGLALECFSKSVQIKRKYMSDLSRELSSTFEYVLPDMQDLCRQSMDNIMELYKKFQIKRSSCKVQNEKDAQNLIASRNAVIDKCEEVLALFEEVFPEDSLELAELYHLIGEVYKWFPVDYAGCNMAAVYLEKTAQIWRKYKDSQSIQIKLASLLVDLGGVFVIQKDYETGLAYRLEALKTIKSIKNVDIETIGQIELSVKGTYEKTVQSKSVEYNSFLEKNGLSTVIESAYIQPLGNGWGNYKVKLRGVKEVYNWKMTLGS